MWLETKSIKKNTKKNILLRMKQSRANHDAKAEHIIYYLKKLQKRHENDVSGENVTHKSLKSELKLTRTHSPDTFNKQKKIAQGFDWLNLLTKLVKDCEKYLEMAKTNCSKHRVDKQASYIEEREKCMVLVMRLVGVKYKNVDSFAPGKRNTHH